jgi:hypothetical protein
MVEIPIGKFVYIFRRIPWREEFQMEFPKLEDQRRVYLSYALTEVSGTPITDRVVARQILQQIPIRLVERAWVMYKAGLPEDRFFTTANLYTAPEILAHNTQVEKEQQVETQVADEQSAALDAAILKNVKKRGRLVPAQAEV